MFGNLQLNRLRQLRLRPLAGRPLGPGLASEQGLTLIECLVAIIVIATVASAITPALVISVATRVQSQKAEQALQLAQAEIDAVRVVVERGDYDIADLPPSTPLARQSDLGVSASTPSAMKGPLYGTIAEATNMLSGGKLTVERDVFYAGGTIDGMRAVNIDGDDDYDFAIQAFRTYSINDPTTDAGVPSSFSMGVRVYDYDAVVDPSKSGRLLGDRAASLGTTGATVGGTGDLGTRPLAALYTSISRSEDANSFCEIRTYLDSSASVPSGCN